MKKCSKCGETKEINNFHIDRGTLDGHSVWCKKCRKIYRDENRERAKWYQILRRYSLTQEEYYNILETQGGVCAICGRTEEEVGSTFHVDHNHETGVVRGILCDTCNRGLGYFREDSQCLQRAVAYISQIN